MEDFSAKDLYTPEKARTLILLSAFINFVKFTEQFCDLFVKNLREHSEKILVEREDMVEELAKVQREIDSIKSVLPLSRRFQRSYNPKEFKGQKTNHSARSSVERTTFCGQTCLTSRTRRPKRSASWRS